MQRLIRLFPWVPLSLISLLGGTLSAEEWNQFRGPHGAGHDVVPTIPAKFIEADRAWNIALPGRGHSSPIAWGSLVFVTAEDSQRAGHRFILAYQAATGKEFWRYDDAFEAYPQHDLNSYAASTPVADAARIYVSWLSGKERRVLALSHTGKKLWEKTVGFYEEEHGSSASPIVVGDLLIVPNDHSHTGQDAGIFALDTATGAVKWSYTTTTPRTAFSTPLLITDKDQKQQLIISSNPVIFTALDPLTGKELWHVDRATSPGSRAVSTPVWADGVLFASVGQGGTGRGAIAIEPGSVDGKTPPKTLWDVDKRIPYVPTPVVHGKRLFFMGDGGIMTCLDPHSGKTLWEERVTTPVYSSPVCLNGHIYGLNRKGELFVVKASETFEKLGELPLGEGSQATPSVAGGRLIVRTDTHLMALGGTASAAKP
jgi:outer membrane protein assembly factor BamB